MKKKFWLFGIALTSCFQTNNHGNVNIINAPGPGMAGISARVLTQGLSYPWEICWGPDNFIWMTERGGRVSRVDPRTGIVFPILNIANVVSIGEGGLLGMALHPDFSKHPQVFIAYDYEEGNDYYEKIVRYSYTGKTLINPVVLLDHIAASGIHNGCRLLISADLKLFITTGDASDQSHPQDISSLNGKILRINLDGTIPSDNPFAGSPVWTYGHRNPQGLVMVNNILYSAEHGPDTDDEVNIIIKGKNYGWPGVRGFCDQPAEKVFCEAHPVKEPVKTWTPTAAICGLDYYTSSLIPQWKNSLLLVALKNARLYQLSLDNTFTRIVATHEYFNNDYGRLRDLCISPGGTVYLCTSNGRDDKIIEISKL